MAEQNTIITAEEINDRFNYYAEKISNSESNIMSLWEYTNYLENKSIQMQSVYINTNSSIEYNLPSLNVGDLNFFEVYVGPNGGIGNRYFYTPNDGSFYAVFLFQYVGGSGSFSTIKGNIYKPNTMVPAGVTTTSPLFGAYIRLSFKA